MASRHVSENVETRSNGFWPAMVLGSCTGLRRRRALERKRRFPQKVRGRSRAHRTCGPRRILEAEIDGYPSTRCVWCCSLESRATSKAMGESASEPPSGSQAFSLNPRLQCHSTLPLGRVKSCRLAGSIQSLPMSSSRLARSCLCTTDRPVPRVSLPTPHSHLQGGFA